MLPRSRHSRTQLHAVTGWLCVALQLLAFAAAGWHHHRHAADQPALTAHRSADDHGPGCASHRHIDSRGDDHSPAHAPCDHQDPQGCTICTAILALHHATPCPRIELIAPLRHAMVELREPPRLVAIAAARHCHARAPPGLA